MTGRANLAGHDIHLRPYPLTGYLYQAELAWRQDSMLRPVVRHLVPQEIEQILTVIGLVHIYEVAGYGCFTGVVYISDLFFQLGNTPVAPGVDG